MKPAPNTKKQTALAAFLWLCAAGFCGVLCFFSACWALSDPRLGLAALLALAGFGWCMERGERP